MVTASAPCNFDYDYNCGIDQNTIGGDYGQYAIRNTTHKYIRFEDGSEALFNLSNDEFERSNLLKDENLALSNSDRAIRDELVEEVTEIRE